MYDVREMVIGSALVLLFVVLIVFAIQDSKDFSEWCASQQGEVVTDTNVGVGVGSGGGTSTVVTADSMCLSEDGRILRR